MNVKPCPGCGRSLKLSPDLAGRKVRCPDCKEIIDISSPVSSTPIDDATIIEGSAVPEVQDVDKVPAHAPPRPAQRPRPKSANSGSGLLIAAIILYLIAWPLGFIPNIIGLLTAERKKGHVITMIVFLAVIPALIVFLVLAVFGVGILALIGLGVSATHMVDTNVAISHLEEIYAAQFQMRQKDYDANATNDFWVEDLAGLYGLESAEGNPLALISRELANADAGSVIAYTDLAHAPQPLAGYLFQSMTLTEDGSDYAADPDGDGDFYTNANHFGFTAYPDSHSRSKFTLIVNEEGQVFQKDTGGAPQLVWPGPDPSVLGWEAVSSGHSSHGHSSSPTGH